jgi:hypothetical protein
VAFRGPLVARCKPDTAGDGHPGDEAKYQECHGLSPGHFSVCNDSHPKRQYVCNVCADAAANKAQEKHEWAVGDEAVLLDDGAPVRVRLAWRGRRRWWTVDILTGPARGEKGTAHEGEFIRRML